LLAAGFNGPIYCTPASAYLLPLVLEDALRVGVTTNERLISKVIDLIKKRLQPVEYGKFCHLDMGRNMEFGFRFYPAGHILGSAFVLCRLKKNGQKKDILFSGDLGAPYTPILSAPARVYGTDVLVLESTYGDRLHEGRRKRKKTLQDSIKRCLQNQGTVLIPAFSIGRTQELLYELEGIIHAQARKSLTKDMKWQDLEIIVDSPLAIEFTEIYKKMSRYFDAEAHRRLRSGRKLFSFKQVRGIKSHAEHLEMVRKLSSTGKPAVVIAASGMCTGGRIVDYLEAMLGDARHDILFVGYQAKGTPGRIIQKYGPKKGYVYLRGQKHDIRCTVKTLHGYSAHADRDNLVKFVQRMRKKPEQIILVHGEPAAQKALRKELDRCIRW
jgi:metallo-beta-lactamase family protein